MPADRLSHVKDEYLPSEKLDLAVEVARAARRPLLLYGDPGSGKSSLARYVASRDSLRYYDHVVTSRTTARDLLWTFDSVRRLGEAQVSGADIEPARYVHPGALWWAFDRDSAASSANPHEPYAEWNSGRAKAGAVVLIDEVDKADPDVPNSLLVPLGDRRFDVSDLPVGNREIAEPDSCASLVVITSNEERDLPAAFVRRCVVYRVPPHDRQALRQIAAKRFPGSRFPLDHLTDALLSARNSAGDDRRRKPSTAEFLDAVRACVTLGITDTGHPGLGDVVSLAIRKDPGRENEDGG
ncbi:MoxR family ATPase [Saccharothrix violaceirubra]|uniref:MoxR-like ATPase n=1 Tax=Saccharothrix violaceirubra TaxID=413306 RepID=A0A7W7T474_9PSEU|nr:MoxR family ATPase [Saccharothrix violaceirubra]MBB4966265.1 MoxR-like ATPase [Saccharothrix violaceirubra]